MPAEVSLKKHLIFVVSELPNLLKVSTVDSLRFVISPPLFFSTGATNKRGFLYFAAL